MTGSAPAGPPRFETRDAVLTVVALGRREYEETLALQQRDQAEVIAGGGDRLLLVEHDPVITLGRGGDATHVLAPAAPVVRVNRGGDVTYHAPGQLVGYPILDLTRLGCDVHRYLRLLEETLILAAASFGVTAGRRQGFTGVWIGNDKLAAIGVGIRRWVTMHGFALNVRDLRTGFAAIVPCGLAGTGVTSLEQCLGAAPAMDAVADRIVAAFRDVFGYVHVADASGAGELGDASADDAKAACESVVGTRRTLRAEVAP